MTGGWGKVKEAKGEQQAEERKQANWSKRAGRGGRHAVKFTVQICHRPALVPAGNSSMQYLSYFAVRAMGVWGVLMRYNLRWRVDGWVEWDGSGQQWIRRSRWSYAHGSEGQAGRAFPPQTPAHLLSVLCCSACAGVPIVCFPIWHWYLERLIKRGGLVWLGV